MLWGPCGVCVWSYFCGKGHTAGGEQATAADTGGHHAKFAGGYEVAEVLDFLFKLGFILVGGFISTKVVSIH